MNTDYSTLPKTFEMMQGGCYFAGTLYRRLDDGHDLFLSVGESELDRLDVPLITHLRRMSNDRREIFVDRVPLGGMDPRLIRYSRRSLSAWIHRTLGVERNLADRLKELAWAITEGKGMSAFFKLWP